MSTPATTAKVVEVKLADIRLDGDTQPRCEINQEVVSEYMELMASGTVFPPVETVHDGAAYWPVDGFHRILAAKQIGRPTIPATVTTGLKDDARWLATGANKAHGLRRSNLDKQRAVETALRLHPQDSDGVIAEHVGVSVAMVGKYRREAGPRVNRLDVEDRVGRDGKRYAAARVSGRGKAPPLRIASPGAEPTGEPAWQPAEFTVENGVTEDAIGQPITDAKIKEVFGLSAVLEEHRRELGTMIRSIERLCETTLAVWLDRQTVCRDLQNASAALKFAEPYAVASVAACQASEKVKRAGWLPKDAFERLPAEQR